MIYCVLAVYTNSYIYFKHTHRTKHLCSSFILKQKRKHAVEFWMWFVYETLVSIFTWVLFEFDPLKQVKELETKLLLMLLHNNWMLIFHTNITSAKLDLLCVASVCVCVHGGWVQALKNKSKLPIGKLIVMLIVEKFHPFLFLFVIFVIFNPNDKYHLETFQAHQHNK